MFWQADRKMKNTLIDLETYRQDTKEMFLTQLTQNPDKKLEKRFETLRDFKFSQPTNLDPAGLVGKLEHVLDNSEDKFDRFIKQNADTENPEELANLQMAFKGVMGTHQIHKVIVHFRQLITKTRNIQLIGMIQMMLPVYQEIAESQREATRAFVNQIPIGDAIGPLVAAKLITKKQEEIEEKAENIIHSQETIEDQEIHVLKSNGPGARLGKYGDALDKIIENNDIKAVITVDAGAKLEGETTGNISEGVGVMMGGPGIEKTKIEETATKHGIPLEGIIIKQSAPEASKPMKKEIYQAYKPALQKTKQITQEFQGPVAIIGVGNTCGIGNTKKDVKNIHNKLRKYWKEYEQQEDDEVSHTGLMSLLGGPNQNKIQELKIWKQIYRH